MRDRDRSPQILASECSNGLAGDLNLDSFGLGCMLEPLS